MPIEPAATDRRPRTVTVTGPNQPGVTSSVVRAFSGAGLTPTQQSQMAVGDRLMFTLQVEEGSATVQGVVDRLELGPEFHVAVADPSDATDRTTVTVVGPELSPIGLPTVTDAIARAGARVDRIQPLGERDEAYQVDVSGLDVRTLRRVFRDLPDLDGIDVAVQPEGPRRRHLIVLDVDQTFIQNEVIELLAKHAGTEEKVKEITARAMRGELDFEQSLHERVRMLEGLDEGVFDRVYDEIELTPGVPIMVMTAQEHGDEIGLISGGFTQITDRLADEWGIARRFTAANTLEVVDGRLTGRVTGPVVDAAMKATKLEEFAEQAGIPIERTIAIGDGANDIEMIKAAGIGIAFNAKPVVRAAAPAAISRRDMTPVLYLRGIPRRDFVHPPPAAASGRSAAGSAHGVFEQAGHDGRHGRDLSADRRGRAGVAREG